MPYKSQQIETKWQETWDREKTFQCSLDRKKQKFYALVMFPYPSSHGLHIGHPASYTANDIVSRYKRAKGFNVLHPMGWDAFGLPAEQYAIKTGTPPQITTQHSIDNFRRQLKMLGFSYDWSREVSTCDPKYYKWTQFLFLKLFEKGLAYRREVPVNWCPALKTVLANEEVIDGRSERGNHPVLRMPMKQWVLKITDYADRLLKDLDKIDWPEGTKELQRNWIGKSEGVELDFEIQGSREKIRVFTTRADTLFGVTALILAPEHPCVEKVTSPAQKPLVQKYQEQTLKKSEIARQELSTEKTGVFTGGQVIHPGHGKPIPVWIADYVMMGYGTGAVMSVPGHDQRDYDFSVKMGLPVIEVIRPETPAPLNPGEVYSGEGIAINSDFITGMKTRAAIQAMIRWAEEKQIGKRSIQYKLRDWLFSRQRYWGEPFPIRHLQDGTLGPLNPDELPLTLPDTTEFEPSDTGESPLARIRNWVETTDPKTGQKARHETDTMPGSAGSSWYFLRYTDPKNETEPWSREAADYWLPVDLYIGGSEHAVGLLLYSRFWTKVFYDLGMIGFDEPFAKMVHQGMILGEDGEKMSKSRGNVVNPDEIIAQHGADALRLYVMFLGPLYRDKPWSTASIEGMTRFLQRSWRIFFSEHEDRFLVTDTEPTPEDLGILHKTIKKVTLDIENLSFNTAISQLMVFVNHFTKTGKSPKSCLRPFIQLLNPFAPHLAEELWQRSGETTSLSFAPWPIHDERYALEDRKTIAIQVLGKMRGTVEVALGTPQAEVERLARELSTVQNQLAGKQVIKVIFVPDKILNFVTKG